MIRVKLPKNKYEQYCKYRAAAYEAFYEAAERLCKKKRFYKNGDRNYWFGVKTYGNTIGKLVDALRFESIVVETRRLK